MGAAIFNAIVFFYREYALFDWLEQKVTKFEN